MTRLICLIILLFSVVTPVSAAEKQSFSNLPIPRFVSLKFDEVNVRIGPGVRYPISWVYRQKNLPVEITDEFDKSWRKIRDADGATGWVHGNQLDGRRYMLVSGKTRVIRRSPSDDAPPLIKAEPKVMGQLLACSKDWCRIQIDSRKGWIRKKEMWGAYGDEEFE